MPRTFLASQLRTRAQERADMVGSTFVSDSEWLGYISASYAELRDLLLASGMSYARKTQTITSVAGTANYNVASDFAHALGVDWQASSELWIPLHLISPEEVNDYSVTGPRAVAWEVVSDGSNDDEVRLYPAPTSVQTYRLRYVPACPDITSASDVIDGIGGWEEYIVVDCAIKSRIKEESDVSTLMAVKEQLRQRIEAAAQNRHWTQTFAVRDVGEGGNPECDCFTCYPRS